MDSKTFWSYVEKAEAKLKEDHSERAAAFRSSKDPLDWAGQPDTGLEIYLVSIQHYERGITPGVVYVLHRRLAAQRIVEATHQVASAAEIKGHLARLEKNRQDSNVIEVRRNRQYVTNVNESGAAAVDTQSPAFAAAVRAAAEAAVADIFKSEAAKSAPAKK